MTDYESLQILFSMAIVLLLFVLVCIEAKK